MIGNYPITWLVTEILSVVLFAACMLHALKQENYKQSLFELLCFIIGSAIFEHVGVLTGRYSYDQHRIMMFGLIPLSILMIESVILYSSFTLFKYLKMPTWSAIWVIGFFCAFQDFSIDPVYVNDKYLINGVMSRQWNWTIEYGNNFFGIPFFNFSGWLYMTGIYAALVLLSRNILKKKESKGFGIIYPFLCGLLLMLPLAVVGTILVSNAPPIQFEDARTSELVKLIVNCLFPIILMIIYRKKMEPIDLKKDGIIFTVPIVLHLYDLIVGFGLGITQSYIPITVTAVIHAIYLFWLFKKAKKVQLIS